jgi:hypothetical protein
VCSQTYETERIGHDNTASKKTIGRNGRYV